MVAAELRLVKPYSPFHSLRSRRTSTSGSHPRSIIYKLATPFKKTSPPPPNSSICPDDAYAHPPPTEFPLEIPELPSPLPRQQRPEAKQHFPPLPALRAWYLPSLSQNNALQPRKPNPFPVLNAGERIIIIAAVDAGNISLCRFGQGAFACPDVVEMKHEMVARQQLARELQPHQFGSLPNWPNRTHRPVDVISLLDGIHDFGGLLPCIHPIIINLLLIRDHTTTNANTINLL
ncbi:hypothetical protein ONZ45_g12179 [Pleurotus djamor]|nr:hypothetical protein ONZ45_g12179 [Pleurotus djamor]